MAEQRPIVLTPGEPSGIGPDLIIQMAQAPFPCPVVVACDPELIERRAAQLALPVALEIWTEDSEVGPANMGNGCLSIAPLALAETAVVGKLNPKNASYVLACLDYAIDGCLQGTFGAHVTGPVHKGIINDAGISFSGHTEYLQARCKVSRVVMMLANKVMRVALATTHLPLANVSAAITQRSLDEVLDILVKDLKTKFGIEQPRLLVAGLNPHAGEAGHMGMEEIDIISPVLDRWRSQGAKILGPLPADTLFTQKYLEHADAVLAMFHDQGLPVLKYAGFGESVNITLGLPIIRTSVDHGTALDLAGSGKADHSSLRCALELASEMAESVCEPIAGH